MELLPITILAGSDGVASPAVGPVAGLHPLRTYKGAALRPKGRPIVSLLAERLGSVEGYGPIRVAGPARVYGELGLDAEIVDTDGSVGSNLRAAFERHAESGCGPMALLACDVLLTTDELAELRRGYAADAPSAVWFPLVQRPSDPKELGVHGWKPTYRVLPAAGEAAVDVLPGHFAVVDPEALRLPLLYRLLDAAYRARNRPLRVKQRTLLGAVLGELLTMDLRRVLQRRAPTRTARTFLDALRIARGLRAGNMEIATVEQVLTRALVRDQYVRETPGAGMRFPLLHLLALAEDIDTREEEHALEGI